MLQDDEVLVLVRMMVCYALLIIGSCQSGSKARHDGWNIRVVNDWVLSIDQWMQDAARWLNNRVVDDWVLSIRGCKAWHDASNILSVGDWVLSIRGCKARHDVWTFGLSMGGFCQSEDARRGTMLRTFVWMLTGCLGATWNPFNECFSITGVSCGANGVCDLSVKGSVVELQECQGV